MANNGANSMETLVDLLRERAAGEGDRLAFSLPGRRDGGSAADHLRRAGRAGAGDWPLALQQAAAAGERALLIFPAGLDFVIGFFGCLYAGLVGIPAPPPEASRLKRTKPRLQSIANDAAASWVLTTSPIKALLEQSGLSVFGEQAAALACH